MSVRKKRVLIVEDSFSVRVLIEEIVRQSAALEIAASVSSAEEALRLLPSLKPDVISLDIRLPGMDGMEATKRIMATQPTSIVIFSANVGALDRTTCINAMRAGALAIIEKPQLTNAHAYADLADKLCRQLAIMSEVPLVRQHRQERLNQARIAKLIANRPHSAHISSFRAIGIVASTGGPGSVSKLLQALGADYHLPVFLVQHITPSFLESFAGWLDGVSPLKVSIAEDGEQPLPGRVYIAPAEHHLQFDGAHFVLTMTPPESGQRPSGTVLLRSMASALGEQAVGVVLTGMGDDGALGLREIYDAGGYTIAEDESSAVVYGMPGAAVRLGAACEQLPLGLIGERIRAITKPSKAAIA